MTLESSGTWMVLRRRVSLAGRVVRREGGSASGGVVQLHRAAPAGAPAGTTRMPEAALIEAPIRRDGSYFYLDLAAADYVTGGYDERRLPVEARSLSVPVADRTRRPPLLAFDLLVEPRQLPLASHPP